MKVLLSGSYDIIKLFPKDNSEFFEGVNMNLVDWLRQYAPEDEQTETFYVVS